VSVFLCGHAENDFAVETRVYHPWMMLLDGHYSQ